VGQPCTGGALVASWFVEGISRERHDSMITIYKLTFEVSMLHFTISNFIDHNLIHGFGCCLNANRFNVQ